MLPHEAAEPFVVRYLPELLVCEGKTYADVVSNDKVSAPVDPPPVSPVPAVTEAMSPASEEFTQLVPLKESTWLVEAEVITTSVKPSRVCVAIPASGYHVSSLASYTYPGFGSVVLKVGIIIL